MVSSHRSHSSGSSEHTVTNASEHSPLRTKGVSFHQTSSTGLYTAYTLIPIPVDNREDAAKYFCTYRGCSFRFDTPCDLQRHRLEGRCSPAWESTSSSDALNGDMGRNFSSGFLRCQLCYGYIASCNYRPLIEHIRTEHCGLPSAYLQSSADLSVPLQGEEPFHAFAHGTDPTTIYNQLVFQEMQNTYTHNHDLHAHSEVPAAPINQHSELNNLNTTVAPPGEASLSNILADQPVEPSDRKGKGAGSVPLDWDKYKSELQRLYVEEDHNLEQVMGHMSTTYGFNAK